MCITRGRPITTYIQTHTHAHDCTHMYTHTNKHSHTTNLSIRGSSLGRVVPGFRALCWMHYKNMYTVNQPLQCNTTLHYDYYCTWNVLWMSGLNSILGFSASCLFPSSSLCQHKRCPNNTRDTRLSMVLRETDRITCFYSENFTGVPSTGNFTHILTTLISNIVKSTKPIHHWTPWLIRSTNTFI